LEIQAMQRQILEAVLDHLVLEMEEPFHLETAVLAL